MANGNNGDAHTRPKRKQRKKTKAEIKFEAVTRIADNLMDSVPNLAEFLLEDEVDPIEFRVWRKPSGGFMALAKYEGSPKDQIAFGVGDSPIEAIYGLEVRIDERGYDDAKTREEWKKSKGIKD